MSKERYWWPHNFCCKGKEFQKFWEMYFQRGEHKVLFILGHGFDPRMNHGLSAILPFINDANLKCMLLMLDEGSNSPSRDYLLLAEKNYQQLKDLMPEENLIEIIIKLVEDGRRVGGRYAANLFKDLTYIDDYTDIIVDVSALPRSIYFPMIVQLLNIIDKHRLPEQKKRNLHVIVTESPYMDNAIIEQELDENASYMFSLSGEMNMTAGESKPIVWFPIIGEGKGEQLQIVYHLLESSHSDGKYVEIEVCPIMPFPAQNPRMPDILIAEYHNILLQNAKVDSRNIMYSDEQNPFDAYRQIIEAAELYNEALCNVDGCRKVISAMSTKLLSLGALLAAFEGEMAVAYVGAQGYKIVDSLVLQDVELFEVWLCGEPYELGGA